MAAIGLQATLGAINFNDDTPDANGAIWLLTEWEGWDGPPLRRTAISPTARHGSILAEAVLDARGVVLEGVCKAPSETAFWASYNLLNDQLNLFSPVDFVVIEGTLEKTLGVVLGGPIKKEFVGVGAFTFQIPMMAHDPLKYTEEQSASLGGDIVNAGNFETYPLIELTAGGDYSFTNLTQGPGATLVVASAPAGAFLDLKNRTLDSFGTDYYSNVATYSVWWALLPGTNTVQKDSGGSATIYWRDAWL